MAKTTFLNQILPMLRLVGNAPDKLERLWPGNRWVKVGTIEDDNTRRLHLLQSDLMAKSAKERSRGNIAAANEFQLKAEACEKIFHIAVYQLLNLFGRFNGIPVIYGKWGVALPRHSRIQSPE